MNSFSRKSPIDPQSPCLIPQPRIAAFQHETLLAPSSWSSVVPVKMKRSHSNEDPADTPNKKSNRGGIRTTNTIQRRIQKIETFYDGLATEKRLKFYEWLPKKGETKVSREKKVGGASPTDGQELQGETKVSREKKVGGASSTDGQELQGETKVSREKKIGGASSTDAQELQVVAKQNLETTSKKTPPSRLVRLDYPPPIPVLADPWAWNDWRTIRVLPQTPGGDKQPKSAAQSREFLDQWRTLEAMGDKMLSVIILTTLKCLKLPFPIMTFLHENLSRNDLWRAWAQKNLPDYPDTDLGDKADAYEVIFRPPIPSLPLSCSILRSY